MAFLRSAGEESTDRGARGRVHGAEGVRRALARLCKISPRQEEGPSRPARKPGAGAATDAVACAGSADREPGCPAGS